MTDSKKRVLITGGAGFIGSHLADCLLAAGHQVVVVDDLTLGRRENLSHLHTHASFQFFEFDLLDDTLRAECFEKQSFDTVFHLAANSDIQAGTTDLTIDFERTFLTTFKTLESASHSGVREFLFASSSAVYGPQPGKMDEASGPLLPISMYGAGKLAGEGFVSAFAEIQGIQSWIFRFPNVVGERCTHGVIYDFMEKLEQNPEKLEILGDGMQEKPYLYVKDLVEGIVYAWTHARERVNLYILGVESTTTVSRIAEILVDEMRLCDVAFQYTGGSQGWVGDVARFEYDLAKIHQLGWKAHRSSDEAVRHSIRQELNRRRGADNVTSPAQ